MLNLYFLIISTFKLSRDRLGNVHCFQLVLEACIKLRKKDSEKIRERLERILLLKVFHILQIIISKSISLISMLSKEKEKEGRKKGREESIK
jgi:hypothetical protein